MWYDKCNKCLNEDYKDMEEKMKTVKCDPDGLIEFAKRVSEKLSKQ